jgi:hypothetical protein
MGLERRHLGKPIREMQTTLHALHRKFAVHVCGEGGEYESLTLDGPLFRQRIVLDETEAVVHANDAFAPVTYLRVRRAHLEPKPDAPPTEHAALVAYCRDLLEGAGCASGMPPRTLSVSSPAPAAPLSTTTSPASVAAPSTIASPAPVAFPSPGASSVASTPVALSSSVSSPRHASAPDATITLTPDAALHLLPRPAQVLISSSAPNSGRGSPTLDAVRCSVHAVGAWLTVRCTIDVVSAMFDSSLR